MATKTAKKKVKRTGKKPARAAKKKATKKKTAKAKKTKVKAKKPTESKKPASEPEVKSTGFAIHEGRKEGDPITESDVAETPPKLKVLDGDPIKAGKRVAYTAVIEDGKYKLGIAAEGEAGYYRIDETSDAGAPFATHAEAVACAEVYNNGLGLTKLEAGQIVLSSIGKQNEEERERDAASSLGESDEDGDDGESDTESDPETSDAAQDDGQDDEPDSSEDD